MKTSGWLNFFATLATVFQKRFVIPLWARYPDADTNAWQAIGVFLEGYAFERRGRSPDFSHMAADVVAELQSKPPEAITSQEAWGLFCDKLPSNRKGGLNVKNNPMAPRGETFTLERKGVRPKTCRTPGLSVIEFFQSMPQDQTLVSWVKKGLAAKRTAQVHRELCRITGVGPKIASLFLRDVACQFQVYPVQDRFLLQPVDNWVKRTVTFLARRKALEYHSVAKWIVKHAQQPELVNQGIWYFGSQVVTSEYRLEIALNNSKGALVSLRDHAGSLCAAASGLNTLSR